MPTELKSLLQNVTDLFLFRNCSIMQAQTVMQVQLPPDVKPGQLITVQSPQGVLVQVQTPPNAVPGQIIQVAVPSYTVPVAMATPAQQTLAPQQLQMQRTQGDAFNCAEAVVIKQEFNLVEVCGIEGKNYYRVHQSMADPSYRKTDGQQLLFVREESECLERICCGPQRTLTLFAHAGYDKNAPTYIQMHKPFHLQGLQPCCRPELHVNDGHGRPIGKIEDPCACCVMDQKIKDAAGQFRYGIAGTICQIGLCCPCCGDVNFHVTNGQGERVGEIKKMFDGCEELCLGTNKFKVIFPHNVTVEDRSLIFASAMLIDLQYFEVQKNNN